MGQEKKREYIKRLLSYVLAAMILSVSSIAMVAALLAQDVFGRRDAFVASVFVILSILYFAFLFLLDRYRSLSAARVKKMVRG